jgi:hypothetical protein
LTAAAMSAFDISDSIFRVVDNGDATKKVALEASAVTTGTTRTITIPNSNQTLGSTVTLGPFHFPDITGSATQELSLLYFTAATAVSLGTTGASSENDLRMPAAGKVIMAFLNTDTARTAGTATLQVRINNVSTAFASGGCVLNATNTRQASGMDLAGLAFAANDLVGVSVVTASWTPTTADVTAFIVVRFD